MSFTPIAEKNTRTEFKKTQFITLEQGATVIRILDPDYLSVETHYIKNMSIKCLGDECPICRNNKIIIAENPETFRTIAGYSPRSTRYYINVLDRTPAKICPSCKAEVKKSGASTCPECNTLIATVQPQPLNRVKVLAKGKTLFEQLVALENAITDENGNKLGLQNFDITLMVAGSGKTTTTTPIYNGRPGSKPEVTETDLFDLTNATIALTAKEINDFQKGVSLKDIYTGRRLSGDKSYSDAFMGAKPEVSTKVPESLESAVQSALDLFKD